MKFLKIFSNCINNKFYKFKLAKVFIINLLLLLQNYRKEEISHLNIFNV